MAGVAVRAPAHRHPCEEQMVTNALFGLAASQKCMLLPACRPHTAVMAWLQCRSWMLNISISRRGVKRK